MSSRSSKRFADKKEEAADLQRRAKELLDKEKCDQVRAIVDRHPEAAEPALTHLASLGYSTEEECSPAPKSAHKKAVESRVANRKAQHSLPHSSMPEQLKLLPPRELVPSKVNVLEDLVVPDLGSRIVVHLDPAAWSLANLRSMALGGRVESTKAE